MHPILRKRASSIQRHRRVRARVHGTAERPRLSVFRSLKHIRAQVIDDVLGRTIAAASDRDVPGKRSSANADIARQVGRLIAERALAAKVTAVVFDRGAHAYHGQVRALADGAREGGLKF